MVAYNLWYTLEFEFEFVLVQIEEEKTEDNFDHSVYN